MDTGDLAVDKRLLSAARLYELRQELARAHDKGLTPPDIGELLVARGYLNEDTLHALEEELFLLEEAEEGEEAAKGEGTEGHPGEEARLPGRLAHYRVEGVLGEGGSGTVFKAEDLRTGRMVALKVLPETLARNRRYVRRFLREARTAAKIHHPNVVEVFEVGRLGRRYFISMELIDGKDLDRVVAERGPLPWREALDIILHVTDALVAAHAVGIVHRDIKPANILRAADGTIKLSDLGLAKRPESDDHGTATGDGVALGTPCYMSPEQARDAKNADTRSDIYSLGATFYHLVTGCPPHTGENPIEVLMKAETQDAIAPKELVPTLPAAVSRVIVKMIRRSPGQRYQTPAELKRVLMRLAKGGLMGRLAALDPATLMTGRASVMVWGLLGILAVLVSAIVYRFWEARLTEEVPLPVQGTSTQPVPGMPEPGRRPVQMGAGSQESPLGKEPVIFQSADVEQKQQLNAAASTILQQVSAMPRNTPAELAAVRDQLSALLGRYGDTDAAEQAKKEMTVVTELIREMSRKELLRALTVIDALAASYRWDRCTQVIMRVMVPWREEAPGLSNKSEEVDKERPQKLAYIGRMVGAMLQTGLVDEAETEERFLNAYWEAAIDEVSIVALLDRVAEARDIARALERRSEMLNDTLAKLRVPLLELDFDRAVTAVSGTSDEVLKRVMLGAINEGRKSLEKAGAGVRAMAVGIQVPGIAGAVVDVSGNGIAVTARKGRAVNGWRELSEAQRRTTMERLGAEGIDGATSILALWRVVQSTDKGAAVSLAESAGEEFGPISVLALYVRETRKLERLRSVKDAYRAGRYIEARDELMAISSSPTTSDEDRKGLDAWAGLVRAAIERTVVMPFHTKFRPTGLIDMTWPPEVTVARENMKFLGFPILPFAKIARGKGASEIGIYSLPQGETAIPGSGERLLTLRWQENGAVTVEGTGADEKAFSSEFERAPEVLLWGEELVVTATNGETRLTFGVTPRLAFGVAGSRNEGMKVTVLADSGWLDDRLITDRRAAFELSQKAGPRDAWRRISADYPGAFPEWIKAACAYAKLMKDEGNPIGGVQLLYGVEPFAAGAERDEVKKWVEEIMLKP